MKRDDISLSVSISGSFNKHLDEIREKILEFQREGIAVLSPKLFRKASREGDFVRLDTDEGFPGEIELRHLESIARSDFLYVVNPKGYIGKSVALEIGYALSRNIPVYSSEKIEDNVFSFFVKPENSVRMVKKMLTRRDKIDLARKPHTLTELQDYVRAMVKKRGFDEETIQNALLLLVEETGELAKATRDYIGLKVRYRRQDAYKNLGMELADCLIYLLDIANLARINLEEALFEKEKLNSSRKWYSRRS